MIDLMQGLRSARGYPANQIHGYPARQAPQGRWFVHRLCGRVVDADRDIERPCRCGQQIEYLPMWPVRARLISVEGR